jgi:hypothetical protein
MALVRIEADKPDSWPNGVDERYSRVWLLCILDCKRQESVQGGGVRIEADKPDSWAERTFADLVHVVINFVLTRTC